MRQPVYQVYYTKKMLCFTSDELDLYRGKVLQYYDQDCLETLYCRSTLPVMIQISGKSPHLVQKG